MKVLLAVDEPSYASAITDFVVSHNWDKDTEFIVMSVIEPLKVGNIMAVLPGPVLDEWMEKRKENAETVTKDTAKRISEAFADQKVEKRIVEGFATEELMKAVSLEKPSLMIVGSHGKHGIDRIILGSVSLFLVSHAPCSVTVIRAKETASQKKKTA